MEQNSGKSYLKGTFWERLVAVIIDELILIIPGLILVAILISVIPGAGDLGQLVFSLIGVIYNVWLINSKWATWGKKIMKLKVVNMAYEKPSLGKIVIRESIGKWLSSLLNLGYLWMIIDKKSQTFHDKMAHTFIIKVNQNGEPITGADRPVTFKSWILFIFLFLFFGLSIALASVMTLVYLFVAQPHKVSGQAMVPNFQEGQYFITSKLAYRSENPQRGDVIVHKNPKDETQDFLKRVVGLPGDEVKIQDCKVYINGNALDETYLPLNTCTNAGDFLQEGDSVIVPADDYFVMGDNREYSSDSRIWGFVSRKDIIGKFWIKYSLKDLGLE
jgi:signal peptidase I